MPTTFAGQPFNVRFSGKYAVHCSLRWVVPYREPPAKADGASDSKSKKKKKPKKKANTTHSAADDQPSTPTAGAKDSEPVTSDPTDESEVDENEPDAIAATNSTNTSVEGEAIGHLANGLQKATVSEDNITERLEAMVNDRDALRAEVTELRQSLEALQSKHQDELSDVTTQLQETQGEKEEAQEQYQNLLGKVNTIKAQLGDRLKSDAVGTYSPTFEGGH